MKNILVGLSSLLIVIAIFYVASNGRAFQGAEAGKIIEDIKTFKAKEEKKNSQANKELKVIKDKAGSAAYFAVSKNYKTKCASCHGVDGNGILGPNLFDKTQEEIYTSLIEYKSGRKENTVMKGLLINIEEDELLELSKEISSFKRNK